MQRLQKYLASCGIASRRAAEQLIREGQVTVNGRLVTQLGTLVAPEHDRIEVSGRPAQWPSKKLYIAVNKPRGVVSTTSDPYSRPTVLGLVPQVGRLFPVGRLDADSDGLMLMTNDGELANRLMHPRYECQKEYRVLVSRTPTAEQLQLLRSGVDLLDGRSAPAKVEVDEPCPGGRQWLRITLKEGRKRQIRRMLQVLDLGVERLQRVRIGSLELGGLPPGESRPLTRGEIESLGGGCRRET